MDLKELKKYGHGALEAYAKAQRGEGLLRRTTKKTDEESQKKRMRHLPGGKVEILDFKPPKEYDDGMGLVQLDLDDVLRTEERKKAEETRKKEKIQTSSAEKARKKKKEAKTSDEEFQSANSSDGAKESKKNASKTASKKTTKQVAGAQIVGEEKGSQTNQSVSSSTDDEEEVGNMAVDMFERIDEESGTPSSSPNSSPTSAGSSSNQSSPTNDASVRLDVGNMAAEEAEEKASKGGQEEPQYWSKETILQEVDDYDGHPDRIVTKESILEVFDGMEEPDAEHLLAEADKWIREGKLVADFSWNDMLRIAFRTDSNIRESMVKFSLLPKVSGADEDDDRIRQNMKAVHEDTFSRVLQKLNSIGGGSD